MFHIECVEVRQDEVVYWVSDGDRTFGVLFEGAYPNIARQSVVGSLLLGLDLLTDTLSNRP